MDNKLLSFSTISLSELKSDKIIHGIEKFIDDIQQLTMCIKTDKNLTPHCIEKFKLLFDIINLYNDNDKILDILKNMKRNGIFDNYDDNSKSTVSSLSTDDSASDSESGSDLEIEDEYQDVYEQFIDREYDNIEKNSVLKKNINIKRDDAVSFG